MWTPELNQNQPRGGLLPSPLKTKFSCINYLRQSSKNVVAFGCTSHPGLGAANATSASGTAAELRTNGTQTDTLHKWDIFGLNCPIIVVVVVPGFGPFI